MIKKYSFLTGIMLLLGALSANAQTCGGNYKVKPGDTLSFIADNLYKDAGKWTAIFQNNIDKIGKNPDNIRVGATYRLTCINGLPTGLDGGVEVGTVAAATPLVVPQGNAANKRKINIVTGDDRLPWSDRSLPNGGMMTDLVDASMKAANPDGGYAIHWVNDWSAHFEPLMSNALLDVGFPWYKPHCENQPDTYRCKNLSFSDPVFEVLVLLFVQADKKFTLQSEADILGKTLCRPKGFATFFLDQNGRNWLKDGKVKLVTPIQSDECFQMLDNGEVDAVVMNEFHGREAIAKLGMKDRVTVAGGEAIAIQGLHVAVHNSHPDKDQLLQIVNDGIRKVKDSGEHQSIVDTHLNRIWASF